MTDHLSAGTRARYRQGLLPVDEFLAADDHLTTCAACREAMAPPLAHAAESMRDAIRGPHLNYEQIEAYVDGRGDGRADASAHFELCAMCAEEVADLAERRTTPSIVWLAAAAIATVVLGTLLAIRRPETPRITPAPAPPVIAAPPVIRTPIRTPELPPIDPILRQLASGILPSAALVGDLRPSRERTRGDEADASLAVLAPIGVIEETRPLFRWTMRNGATYTVEVFDASYRGVARSDAQRTNQWRPSNPLARGAIYSWQVTENDEHIAPAPPAPPARFKVISAASANEIGKAKTALDKALLYAREGIVDRALEEMQRIDDPTPEVRKAIETLRRYQPAPTTTKPAQ